MRIVYLAVIVSISAFLIGYFVEPEIYQSNQESAHQPILNNSLQILESVEVNDKNPIVSIAGYEAVDALEFDFKQLLSMSRSDYNYDLWRNAKVIDALNRSSLSELFYLLEKEGLKSFASFLLLDALFIRDPIATLDYIVTFYDRSTQRYKVSNYLKKLAERSPYEGVEWLSRQSYTILEPGELERSFGSAVSSLFSALSKKDETLALSYLSVLHVKFRSVATEGIASNISSSARFQTLIERFTKSEHAHIVAILKNRWAREFPKGAEAWYMTQEYMPKRVAWWLYAHKQQENFEDAATWYLNQDTISDPLDSPRASNTRDPNSKIAKVFGIVGDLSREISRERVKAWIDVQQNEIRDEGFYSLLWQETYSDVNYAIENLTQIQNRDNRYYLSRRIGAQLSKKDKVAMENFVNNSEFASRLQTEPWY